MHERIVPIPLPTTLSSTDSNCNSCPSSLDSSEMTQQVFPAPFDLNRRQTFVIPWRCRSQSLRLGSTFHGTAVANRSSNQRKCANSFVNFLRFLGVERNDENRSCRPRTTKAFIVACSCSACNVVSIAPHGRAFRKGIQARAGILVILSEARFATRL